MTSQEDQTSSNRPERRRVVQRTALFMNSLKGIQKENHWKNLLVSVPNNLNAETLQNDESSENVIPEREVYMKLECTSVSNCRNTRKIVNSHNSSEAHLSQSNNHETPITCSGGKKGNSCAIGNKTHMSNSNTKSGNSCAINQKSVNSDSNWHDVNRYDSRNSTCHGNYKLQELEKYGKIFNKTNEIEKVDYKHEDPFKESMPNFSVANVKMFPEVCNSATFPDLEKHASQASISSGYSSCTLSESQEFPFARKEYVEAWKTESGDELDKSFTPDPEQIEAISDYLTKLEKEWTVCDKVNYNRVQSDLNRLFKYHLEGNRASVYGSYYSGFAISTSDINIALQADVTIHKNFMYEVYKVLSKELRSDYYHVLPFEDTIATKKSKIFFTERSGISCKLEYLGRNEKNVFQMGNLLKNICNCNPLVKSLIIIVRIWAEMCSINETEVGRLHSLGFTLLAIHFLQQYKKSGTSLLPVINKEIHCEFLEPTPRIDVSVGELWLEFLKYYGFTFNWTLYFVSITSAKPLLKSSKSWKHFWMAIEDPYSGKNIAESVVNSDVALFIQSRFRSFYKYFSHPFIDDFESNSTNINQCDAKKTEAKKWHFSFSSCETEEDSPFFCEECDDDYTCENCESKFYQPVAIAMENLPDLPDSYIKVIDKTLFKIYGENILTNYMIQKRMEFVHYLENYFRIILPGCNLQLFGSSVNGFGFKTSDLDICLTINRKSLEEINQSQVLWKLRCHLCKNRNFKNVYALFSAQIPIIKFWYIPNMWQGDISLYNLLAVHNSKLLYKYSLIDERCRIIGCAMKMLAKNGCIADSAEKTLSSYSYLLMVIHYLQQTNPPVLPVLQDVKLFNMDLEVPVKLVDGWNVWFCSDIKNLDLGSVQEKNKDSVGKLWVGLLDYYLKFNNDQVITIRQKEPMYVAGRKWRIARLFNIEDPFILSRNLGCVLSDKKAHETVNVFRRARQVFGHPLEEFQTEMQDFKDFFFSTRNLTGRYVEKKECRLCGKVGHEKNDCIFFKPKFYPLRKPNRYK